MHTYAPDGSSVTCTLGPNAAGTYPLEVTVVAYGTATGSVEFMYELEVVSLSESSGMFIAFMIYVFLLFT